MWFLNLCESFTQIVIYDKNEEKDYNNSKNMQPFPTKSNPFLKTC